MQTFPSLFLSHHFAARGGPGAQAGGACPGPRVAPSSPKPWPGWKLMGLERGSPGRSQRPKEPDRSFGGMGKSGLGFTGSSPPPLPRAPPRWPFGDAALGSLGRCPCARSCASRLRAPVRPGALPCAQPPGGRRWCRVRSAGPSQPWSPSPHSRSPTRRRRRARTHSAEGSWILAHWRLGLKGNSFGYTAKLPGFMPGARPRPSTPPAPQNPPPALRSAAPGRPPR